MAITFSADEIKRQANKIREQSEEFKRSCTRMLDVIYEIEYILKEESINIEVIDIRKKLIQLENSYIDVQARAYQKFQKLADIMEIWAKKTIQNEEQIADYIDDLSKKMEEIMELLNEI